jgi:hypothetical protein
VLIPRIVVKLIWLPASLEDAATCSSEKIIEDLKADHSVFERDKIPLKGQSTALQMNPLS